MELMVLTEEQPLVTDYERKRQYYWTAPERARICGVAW